jgi:GrpB-like predicted nucleotidyltransferase (UPF0157 family)
MRLDAISMADYDPAWPVLFEQQRQAVTLVFHGLLLRPIEHIGSTSVPGLMAKPIIDMLAVVTDHDAVEKALSHLPDIGWVLVPEPGDDASRKHSACYPSVEQRSHHLHVFEETAGWPDLLLYRDYLRAHPAVAEEYAALKRRLAELDDQDRPRYRAAKAPFILGTLDSARRWQANGNGTSAE